MKFWQPVKITEKTYYTAKLGLLQVWLVREGNELLITDKYLSEEQKSEEEWEQIRVPLEPCGKPDSTSWKRWIVPQGELTVRLSPVMPDRPILVQPESQIQILPGSSTLFYVSLPVWLRISTADEKVLTAIPTQILSNTWFGEPHEGELCYAVKSTAKTDLEKRKVKTYVATCPISIENHSLKNFVFQRLSVHTEYLNIYAGAKHLWTNRIEVKIEGEDQKSLIDISETAPSYEKIKEQLSTAREVPSKKFHRKMFSDFPFIRG